MAKVCAAVVLPPRRPPGTRVSLRAPGIGLPFYREMRMHWPRLHAFLAQARADRLDLIHSTTPGPVGLAARDVAAKLRLPMIGRFHTLLSEYTEVLSGSPNALSWLLREPVRRVQMGVAARHAMTRSWPLALEPLFETWREAHRAVVAAPPPAGAGVGTRAAGFGRRGRGAMMAWRSTKIGRKSLSSRPKPHGANGLRTLQRVYTEPSGALR